jgi:hypothetical protein
MDESLFYGRSQHRTSGRESGVRRLRGMSDDMVRQNGAESLTSLPTGQVGSEKRSSYKEMKRRDRQQGGG